MFTNFTKRQLGLIFVATGALGVIGVALYSVLRHHPIGAYQAAAIAGSVLISVIGATLIPLGSQPL